LRIDRPVRNARLAITEILAAMVNGATLVAVSFFIVFEAWHRFSDPPEVQGGLMMWIAVGGLVVNLFGLAVLHGGKDHSLNVRGAWLHVLSDTLGSVAAIVAGLLIQNFGWYIADPIISAVISLLVVVSAWRLILDSTWVLMQAAPLKRRAFWKSTTSTSGLSPAVWTQCRVTSFRTALNLTTACCNVCVMSSSSSFQLITSRFRSSLKVFRNLILLCRRHL
jgi:Co/Zn/Cd efflux system component